MKILQINAVYGYLSTGIIVENIEDLLHENGWETGVVYQKASKPPRNGYRMGNWLDWKIHALWTRLSGKQAYASQFSTKKMIRWLQQQKPDVVHLHNLHSNYICLNMLLKYLAENDIPTVITLHDCWYFTGKCFHYMESKCEKWKVRCQNCPRKKQDVKSFFFDQSRAVFRDKEKYLNAIPRLTIVGCSDWICDQASMSILKDRPIQRVYNGIDTAVFTPDDRAYRKKLGLEDKFVILGAANKWLNPMNQGAMQAVLDKLEENDRVVLFACTPEQVEQLREQKNVVALGYIHDQNQMASLFDSADVFVNMTLADTLPTVNMEALSCGTPVITFDSCGSPELIDDGVTGYVVPACAQEPLVRAIKRVKNGEISLEACRKAALQKFNRKNNYCDYLKIYENVINKA